MSTSSSQNPPVLTVPEVPVEDQVDQEEEVFEDQVDQEQDEAGVSSGQEGELEERAFEEGDEPESVDAVQ